MTRRTLLTAASVLSTTQVRGANERVNVTLVGLGGRGQDHAKFYSEVATANITGVCDVNQAARERGVAMIEKLTGRKPKEYSDMRQVFDDKSVDAVSLAIPNHWHALATIWACQAGKDVYVEKPVSHNVTEGRRMVEAARKYNRIVQTGTQCRSHKGIQSAMEFLHSGKLGKVFMAKGLCYKRRDSIGIQPDSVAPETLNYDLWTGPADLKPFNANRLHYNWHWFWNTGNGDLGNQGIHQMDLARWGLNKNEFPKTVMSSGGRLGYKDQGETPNTQMVAFEFDDALMQFEVRGRDTNDELGVRVGDIFYGTEGVLAITSYTNWQAYMGPKLVPGATGSGGGDHYRNFVDSVRARDYKKLNADIEQGHFSSAYCHLGNISYKLGRKLTINPATETFVNDSEADALLTREYRKGFEVPAKV